MAKKADKYEKILADLWRENCTAVHAQFDLFDMIFLKKFIIDTYISTGSIEETKKQLIRKRDILKRN